MSPFERYAPVPYTIKKPALAGNREKRAQW